MDHSAGWCLHFCITGVLEAAKPAADAARELNCFLSAVALSPWLPARAPAAPELTGMSAGPWPQPRMPDQQRSPGGEGPTWLFGQSAGAGTGEGARALGSVPEGSRQFLKGSPESGESAGGASTELLEFLLKRAPPQERGAQNSQGPVRAKMLKTILGDWRQL